MDLDLNLVLPLPIQLPALEIHTKTAYDACILVSNFQSVLRSGVTVAHDLSTAFPTDSPQTDSSTTPSTPVTPSSPVHPTTSTTTPSRLVPHHTPVPATTKSLPSKLVARVSAAIKKALSNIDKIANLLHTVSQKPINLLASFLSYSVSAMGVCTTTENNMKQNMGLPPNVPGPLHVGAVQEFNLPPSPAQPILTYRVKNLFSACVFAESLRAAMSSSDSAASSTGTAHP